MTVDLLSQRLKAAKRELTNLKTAHGRGLGLLRVYTYSGTATPPTNEAYYFVLTINFERGFARSPFASFLLVTEDPSALFLRNNLEIDDVSYSSDGYSMILQGARVDFADWSDEYKIISTAPITNMNWEWTLL